LDSAIGKQVLGLQSLAFTGGNFVKPIAIVYGIYQFMTMPSYGYMDEVIKGFFERNNIPTSHTIITHDGYPDMTAAVLLYAQMSAAYSFFREHSSYFFSTTWAGATMFAPDQSLMSQLGGNVRGGINTYVNIFRRNLNDAVRSREVFLINTNVGAVTSTFRQNLNNFHIRANFMNTLFVTTIAGATCAALTALSQVTPIPPQLTQFSEQTAQQSATNEAEHLRLAHTRARNERNQAWEQYQTTRRTAFSPSREIQINQARRDFEAANEVYRELSRARRVLPTRPN